MILSLVMIGVVGLIGYIWCIRGFFSALINFFCVVLAGAVAFAAFEPVQALLLDAADPRGFFSFLSSVAPGLALGGVFAVALAMFRALLDGILRANVKVTPAMDYVGGGLCGALAGVIIAGILAISLGSMRVGSEFFGNQTVKAEVKGVEYKGGLWLPVDQLVGALYGHASLAVFSSPDPLAHWYPELHTIPAALRASYGDGKGNVSIKAADFAVVGAYRVSGNAKELLEDSFAPGVIQQAVRVNGEPINGAATIYGVGVNFLAGAKEAASGQVVVGPSQIRLVARGPAGERENFYPVAVVAKGAAGEARLGRFRYDAPGTYIGSVGGDAESAMVFEFLLPQGFEPTGLFVKGTRANLPPTDKVMAMNSIALRDAAIRSGNVLAAAGSSGKPIDESRATVVGDGRSRQAREDAPHDSIKLANTLHKTLQEGSTTTGLEVVDGKVISGKTRQEAKLNLTPPRELRVDRFDTNAQVNVISIDVSMETPQSLLSAAASAARAADENNTAPFIVDSNGVRYTAVGYMYVDDQVYEIQFYPGQPIRSLAELPPLSRSQPNQKLMLIFRPSRGVVITGFGIGDTLITKYIPPFKLDQVQK